MVVGIAFPMGKTAKLRKPKKSRYSGGYTWNLVFAIQKTPMHSFSASHESGDLKQARSKGPGLLTCYAKCARYSLIYIIYIIFHNSPSRGIHNKKKTKYDKKGVVCDL